MTPTSTNIFKQAAINTAVGMAAAELGLTVDHIKSAAVASEVLEQSGYGRVYAQMADAVLVKAGMEGSMAQQLYHQLWRTPADWNPAFEALVEPVKTAMASSLVKQALSPLGSAMVSGASNVSNGGLSTLVQLVLGGTALGSGLGALNWHLSRDSAQDDEKNEVLKAKSDFYKHMAQQIAADHRLQHAARAAM
jgi:hypothetical protein